jgi:hypothetical protein
MDVSSSSVASLLRSSRNTFATAEKFAGAAGPKTLPGQPRKLLRSYQIAARIPDEEADRHAYPHRSVP